jgi:hypothetical protein
MHSPTKARANVIKLQSIKNVIQRVSDRIFLIRSPPSSSRNTDTWIIPRSVVLFMNILESSLFIGCNSNSC